MSMEYGVGFAAEIRDIGELSDRTFRDLRDFVYQNTGIYFQDKKKYLLEGRIAKRIQHLGLHSFEAYVDIVKYGSSGEQEKTRLFDAVTINETFFFRNEPHFLALENVLVPEFLARKAQSGSAPVRFWSAASSSGEEPYSLAMLYLERLRPKFPDLKVEIVGTDINTAVLAKARHAVYAPYSLRGTPKEYVQKYFVPEDGRYRLKEEVRNLVRFHQLNLYDRQQMRTMRFFDFIFCCNVLIYFDTKSKVQVVSDLYTSLNQKGHLFMGYSEVLHGISSLFKPVNVSKSLVYKKE